MKKFYLLLFVAPVAAAQIPLYTTSKFVDKNYVRARINSVDNRSWDTFGWGSASYEVPKGKGAHAQFANSIWIGGYDHNGKLHLAANTYMQNGRDFWGGPLDTTSIGAYTATNTAVYNKLWKVDCSDISNFATAYNNGSVTANTYTIPADLLTYPAKGTAKFMRNMEPFYDANLNGIYDPQVGGDYPIIKGHQQVLSIYNDTLSRHKESKSGAMGIEVHERSYAYFDPLLPDSMQAVNYSTFYHFTIFNRSAETYTNVFISDWSDVDLGYYADDFVGTDSLNNFTYVYNGDSFDETAAGVTGYGSRLPVISHAILKTNCMDGIDNDGDNVIDEPGESFVMNRSTFYNNNIGPVLPATTNPDSAKHYFQYMAGIWKDGTPFTYGGQAYGGTRPTDFVYTGNPATNTGWTEMNAGNTPGDRRIFTTSGPFTLPAGAKIEWGYAIVFSHDTTNNVNAISQFNTRVRPDVRNVLYYDQMHQNAQCTPMVMTGLRKETINNALFSMWPNPTNGAFTIALNEKSAKASVKVRDISGRVIFETTMGEDGIATINLSACDKGIYLVEVSSGNNTVMGKVIRN